MHRPRGGHAVRGPHNWDAVLLRPLRRLMIYLQPKPMNMQHIYPTATTTPYRYTTLYAPGTKRGIKLPHEGSDSARPVKGSGNMQDSHIIK